jgi:RimJ/RimL family protein N-acetyltransferase
VAPQFAPEINTDRLTLRGHRLEDFAESAAMWADPKVTRHIGGRAFTEEEVWARLLRYSGHWLMLGFGYWVVREAASGRFVGEAGLADFRRPIQPPFGGAPEAGWALATWAHGQGFATEAVRAVAAWGSAHLPSARTVCMIHPDNAASLKVAAKCGYREYARTRYKDEPTVLLQRER